MCYLISHLNTGNQNSRYNLKTTTPYQCARGQFTNLLISNFNTNYTSENVDLTTKQTE